MFGYMNFMAQRAGHKENLIGSFWRASKYGAGGE